MRVLRTALRVVVVLQGLTAPSAPRAWKIPATVLLPNACTSLKVDFILRFQAVGSTKAVNLLGNTATSMEFRVAG
jgi:uncharacterized protein YjeT (DUF2065 family)